MIVNDMKWQHDISLGQNLDLYSSFLSCCLNFIFVVERWIGCGIQSHSSIPQQMGLLSRCSLFLCQCLNFNLFSTGQIYSGSMFVQILSRST